jgi:alpha-L-rhamnosidase
VLKEQTQCGFALLFYFGLFDTDEQRKANAVCFKKLIRDNGNHLDTGFIGTAYLCPALVKAGLSEVACDLVLQRDYPSWLFEVDNGATTIWERWDSYHPDKGFASPVMNSFNHYANGAVGEFLFANIGGVSFQAVDDDGNVAPRVIFHVTPDVRIGSANFHLETPCGEAVSEWRLDGRCLQWHVRVPPNTVGIVDGSDDKPLAPGEYDFSFDT